jgi:adenylosuccinate lyase
VRRNLSGCFLFATILNRIVCSIRSANHAAENLEGKISGAVGAYNAQIAIGIGNKPKTESLEERVLGDLDLKVPKISTQIVQPEPLFDYLSACIKLSAALGQFGRDGRHLMRSEIGELCEPFEKGR